MTPRQAVINLAKRYGITVQETARNDGDCCAYRTAKLIRVMPINSYKTFIIALHELGHIVGNKANNKMLEEVRAWANAKHFAGKYWNARAERIMYYYLNTHYVVSTCQMPNIVLKVMSYLKRSQEKCAA